MMRNKQLKRISKAIRKIDWKSCLVGFILSTLILLCCFNLLVIPRLNQSFDRQLQEAIDACPYDPSRDYRKGVFDSSNMANMLDDWLEEKYGYETYIVCWFTVYSGDYIPDHAMVIANGRLIEPTTKKICYTFRTKPYLTLSILTFIIDDVERLPDYNETKAEWNYTKSW